jgi:NAD(P)-dependent dehydrogenase (short-subunit alcohol dehydrogenase family)
MSGPFAGRVALVTGASRGIGRATAVQLATAGATVALVSRSQDDLGDIADQIGAAGGTAAVYAADIADPTQALAAATAVKAAFGPVDILVNNAGVVAPLGPTAGIRIDEWMHAIAVNLTAVFQLSGIVIPAMTERGWGRVVNVSSGIAAHPAGMVGGNAYATTKAALEAHTVNLAAELVGTGVTVNAYRPGSVDTAMQAWIRAQEPAPLWRAMHQRFIDSHAHGALITPAESARSLVEHLEGDETGQVWDVVGA